MIQVNKIIVLTHIEKSFDQIQGNYQARILRVEMGEMQ